MTKVFKDTVGLVLLGLVLLFLGFSINHESKKRKLNNSWSKNGYLHQN